MITFADRKGGFPHSEISGSKGARASPELIAACHVLHRLSTPRHPSEALMRLIVLSKTHAWGRKSVRRPYEGPVNIPHMRFVLSLPDNDVFIRSVLKPRGTGRTNPSIHDVIEPPASSRDERQATETCCFPRSLGRSGGWWSQTGSNRRPHACKARALPTELWPL
jgi:hypothetical protein